MGTVAGLEYVIVVRGKDSLGRKITKGWDWKGAQLHQDIGSLGTYGNMRAICEVLMWAEQLGLYSESRGSQGGF